MNESTFDKLEFDEIREMLASHCHTSIGKQLARSVTPSTKSRLVRQWLAQVEELLALENEHGFPPMGGVHDIREAVRSSAFPAPLEPGALADVAETLIATGPLCDWFARTGEHAVLLGRLGERIRDLSWLGREIYEAVDPRGQVRDYASPKLATIRRAIEEARERIRRVCDRILRQAHVTKMLQYAGATVHNDRTVLPLRAEYRGRIPGIIHRSSDSGATLFVEPAESVELNNGVVRLRDEESKEITRILIELSRQVRQHAKEILSTVRAIGVVDVVAAKSRYSQRRSCACPKISEDGTLDLRAARHPILLELFEREKRETGTGRDVVPIDIRLGDDFDVLIVTGPNTGGKTVALKSVGLLALMTQCGIPIPAGEGSKMPVYKDIFVDVGDEQSLQQSLSTFSSHLSTLLAILNGSNERSLVLIDELGAGTDPDEGAAIGRAIVTELLELRAKAVVTTHISALKAVAFTTKRVDNAAVDFDTESLRPTYRLRLGEPGNSNALTIAERLGMSPRLVKSARGFLDDNARALSKAIAGTLGSRREAERARGEADQARLSADKERAAFEKERQELERSREAFDAWTRWVSALDTGDEVFIRPLRKNGKVVRMRLQRQRAVVAAGAMEIEVPLRDIEAPQGDEQ